MRLRRGSRLPFGARLSKRGIMAGMNIHRIDALVAILDRIDKQIVESDVLLLKSLSVRERHRVTDEMAYLQIERRNAATKLQKCQ